jgi:eukaryotic-like serine/threonine-protein kinase
LDRDQRRVAFRQVLAALALSAFDEGPSPLEGIRADELGGAVELALEEGLFDDLDWLSPGQGGAAICHLAAALPPGTPQRELGRRGIARMLSADAGAFVTIATQLARAGGRGLSAPAVAARVALLVELPLAFELNDTNLAFAIASRKKLAERYIIEPSTRSLPERRLAARLLERAAVLAVKRARAGDRSSLRLVGPDGHLGAVWARLLADREPLVWRHVALARGLTHPATTAGIREFAGLFSPSLTPTEWRRAAVMLGGFALVDGSIALDLTVRALEEGLFVRDSGAASGFIWSLARVSVQEPDLARELFDLAEPPNPSDVAEGVLALSRELGASPFLDYARNTAIARVSVAVREDDDGARALLRELAQARSDDLEEQTLVSLAERALLAFHERGAVAALEAGHALLESARGAVDTLLVLGEDDSPLARRTAFNVVRDLDLGFLERDILSNLLRLDPRETRVRSSEEVVEHLRDKIFHWLVERSLMRHIPTHGSSASGEHMIPVKLDHVGLHLSRVRAFLHLVDSDALGRSDDADRLAVRRFQHALRALVDCFHAGPPGPLRRAMVAAFARCLDALVRASACDVSDVLLVALGTLAEPRDLEALAEAAMDPDVARLLVAASALWGKHPPRQGGSIPIFVDSLVPRTATEGGDDDGSLLSALELVADELADVGTARSDGLRAVVSKLHQGLASLREVEGLSALSIGKDDGKVLGSVESAAFAVTQLVAGAFARILDAVPHLPPRSVERGLSGLVEGALRDGVPVPRGATRAVSDALSRSLPPHLSRIFSEELQRLEELPLEAPAAPARAAALIAPLPDWVPERRTLGAFWVERPLAAGGVGSVFVVTRTEDRFERGAERFALKVPDYNANAARHLSESEFLALFRAEASALVSLPSNEALARFVTFDLAARPKPILVMELIEGPNLERLIDSGALHWEVATASLLRIADGLAAMHDADVGHLDLKPANVVLRRGHDAVLVDFGLAGRHIRPGCGSAPYAAPEVWNHDPARPGSPMAADVYSFGCLVFETLTGQVLFDADNELHMISQHLAHDGFPPKLRDLASNPNYASLAELLFSLLRREPANRLTLRQARPQLERKLARLKAREWPIGRRELVPQDGR